MKSQKLLVNSAAACLLVGVSSAAMAVDCANGFIIGETLTEDIIIDGQACHIEEVVVDGSVIITNSPAINMIDVEVAGTVNVTGPAAKNSRVSLTRVDSFNGNITVQGHAVAIVSANIVRGGAEGTADGNMTVKNNTAAVVYSNIVTNNLTCTDNTELDEFFNRVLGTEDCVAN